MNEFEKTYAHLETCFSCDCFKCICLCQKCYLCKEEKIIPIRCYKLIEIDERKTGNEFFIKETKQKLIKAQKDLDNNVL